MDLKSLLGKQYKEDMSVEDILALDIEVPDLTGYISKKRFDEVASEAANFKKQLRASMSEAEQKAAAEAEEKEKLLSERDELNEKLKIIETSKQYMALGYDEENATRAATALLKGDISAVLKSHADFVDEQKKNVLAEAMKNNAVPPAGNTSSPTVTLENLRKMSMSDRLKFSKDNPEEYNRLYGGN